MCMHLVEVKDIIADVVLLSSNSEYFLLQGPDLVIHQSKECLDRMGEWCQNHHAASGMWLKTNCVLICKFPLTAASFCFLLE